MPSKYLNFLTVFSKSRSSSRIQVYPQCEDLYPLSSFVYSVRVPCINIGWSGIPLDRGGIMVIQRTITQRILEHLWTNCLSIVRPIKLKNYKIIFGWKLNSTWFLSSIDDINFKPKLVAATSLKTVDYCSSALGWSSKKLTSGDSGDVGSF